MDVFKGLEKRELGQPFLLTILSPDWKSFAVLLSGKLVGVSLPMSNVKFGLCSCYIIVTIWVGTYCNHIIAITTSIDFFLKETDNKRKHG